MLVAAVGRPEMIRGDWIKPGAVVIDVGINRTRRRQAAGRRRVRGRGRARRRDHAGPRRRRPDDDRDAAREHGDRREAAGGGRRDDGSLSASSADADRDRLRQAAQRRRLQVREGGRIGQRLVESQRRGARAIAFQLRDREHRRRARLRVLAQVRVELVARGPGRIEIDDGQVDVAAARSARRACFWSTSMTSQVMIDRR